MRKISKHNPILTTATAIAEAMTNDNEKVSTIKDVVSEMPTYPSKSVAKTVTLCSPSDNPVKVAFPAIFLFTCPSKQNSILETGSLTVKFNWILFVL